MGSLDDSIIIKSMEETKSAKKSMNGRWTTAEHKKFMLALEKYGRNWTLIQKKVKTRSLPQVRSHAQKVFLNLDPNDIDALIGYEGDSPAATQHFAERGSRTSARAPKQLTNLQNTLSNSHAQQEAPQATRLGLESGDEFEKPSSPSTCCLTISNPRKPAEPIQQVDPKASCLFIQLLLQNPIYFLNGGDFLSMPPPANYPLEKWDSGSDN